MWTKVYSRRTLRLLRRVGVVGPDPRQHVGWQTIGEIDMSEPSSDGDRGEQDGTARKEQQRPRHGGTSVLSSEAQILAPTHDEIELNHDVVSFNCVETTAAPEKFTP
jgi:hypothetical protein